jgi:hypothetical protein
MVQEGAVMEDDVIDQDDWFDECIIWYYARRQRQRKPAYTARSRPNRQRYPVLIGGSAGLASHKP